MTAAAQPSAPWQAHRLRSVALGVGGLAAWGVAYASIGWVARTLTYDVVGFSIGSRLAATLEFFLYETPKVLLLLTLIVFVVGIVRSFFSPERTRRLLAGRRQSIGNVLAAGLGVVTPFCSCSAVPLFIGFVTAGVPLGVTFSFLIAAPMVNEVALVLLFGLVGWKVALLYAGTGLAIAVVAGWVIGRLQLEGWVEPWVYCTVTEASAGDEGRLAWADRLARGREAVRDIVGKVWPYVLVGIVVGAGIHGFVPQDVMASLMGRDAWWAVPVSVLFGVPMYANAAGIVPVIQALLSKGAALGTALAFMMAVVALSLPEAIILRKVLTAKLIAVFLGIVAAGILAVGYLFNTLL